MTTNNKMHTFGILSSGPSNTFRHIHTAIQEGVLPSARIGLVICNHPDTPILAEADKLGVPRIYIPGRKERFDQQAREHFKRAEVDAVLLIGYVPKVGPTLLSAYPNRMFNLHGGPIPQFGGKGMMYERTQEAVLASGAVYGGPTIHVVDEEYDHGAVLSYWPVKVRSNDTPATLNERCNLVGRHLYVAVLRDFIFRLEHPELFD